MSRKEPTDAEWRVMAVEGLDAGEPPMWPSLVIRLLDRLARRAPGDRDLGVDYLEMQRLHIQLGDEMGEVREALAWALDLIDRYDQVLIDRGNPVDTVLTPFHVAEKAKARRALLARRAPGDRDRLREAVITTARRFIVPDEDADPIADDEWDPLARDLYDAVMALDRALAADSRPEQPAPLDAGYPDLGVAYLRGRPVRPEEPPE